MAWHGWCGRLFVRCGVDRLVVGSQAFYYASAFNANIGGWNTASVTALSSVLAPLRPSRTSQPRNRSADVAVARRKQSRRRCGSTKHILLHENMLQRAASCLRRRHGTDVAVGFGAVRCGPRVVGLQAFYYASAFNMNIGGWNTASVTTLSSV